jgi:pimeloyl-ACP methyl ester carboxylesterase
VRRLLAVALLLAAVAALVLTRTEAPAGPTGAWMAAAGVEPRFETVAGLRVRYVRAGSGPAVVLIHGLGASIYTWHEVLPALARDHDVVALDLPGFGGSDLPLPLRAELFPRVVLGLLDRLGIARASFVGNSLGGAVAVTLAAAHPERVLRLVLIDAAGFNLSPEGRPWLLRVGAGPAGAGLERLPFGRSLITLALRQVFDDDSLVTAERVDEYLAPLQRPGAKAAVRSLLSDGGAPSAGEFERLAAGVTAPTLVVWGAQDAWIPAATADRFVAAIPGAKKVVLEGCGHMPQEERADETLTLLRGFL